MATKAQLKPFFLKIYEKSDGIIERLLFAYFAFGIGISFIYDTYAVGIGVGMLSLILYFTSKQLFKGTTVNQYVASLVAGIFMAQFIYQMHGLFEMHFTAFIAIIALITYQNKYAFIPQLLFVVIHHSSFAYIQYLGYINENESYKQIYFTQLEFMDFQTFLFHAGLYAVGVVLAAIYTHNLERNTIENAENIIKLQTAEERMNQNIEFAKRISEGEFNYEYALEEGDQMGSALVSMNSNLKESSVREKQESFKNVGLTEIGDIIRNHSENLNELTYQIVSYLVTYMKLNQGGVFILNDDDEDNKFLELKGCYAYERKKFLEKRIGIGEGLIGQCYLERSVIYLKDVPKDYVRITSGLGDAPPSNLIIVPIKNEDTIEGVMELASFKLLEQYEIDFLTRACENIATTIASAKINARTKLLYEESQQQTEEMRAQEEEMRQNMEELSATQEEMERTSLKFKSKYEAINGSGVGSIEFDLYGNIVEANDAFCELMMYEKDEVIGKHHRIFVDKEYAQSESYRLFWNELGQGKLHKGEFTRYNKKGKSVILLGAYSVLKNEHDVPVGVIKFAMDITKLKA
ncbi:GAF domain-containing protein [Fulvivirga sp.]|jgi:methyl-accepting chemotaxis protein|uniref:GAF domain-containing protein n=1 Tax=Fulvivirga sp. TaxID=1931237 RepID=UPI0032ED34A1